MTTKQAYEVEGIRSEHYADLWQATVKLYRVPFVNTSSDPWADEQMHFICRIEPTSPLGHVAQFKNYDDVSCL